VIVNKAKFHFSRFNENQGRYGRGDCVNKHPGISPLERINANV